MGVSKQILEHGKMQQIIYLDETLLRKLKAYALETGQPFHKLIAVEFSRFEQELIVKSIEIDKLRMQAIEAYKKAKEEQEIAAEHPLEVPGHQINNIEQELEQPIIQ